MTACSWRFYVASDFSIFFFDEKVDIPRNFSREVTSSFPCIKIFLFWFYRSRIWINRNRTLVGFDFNLNFFVYFCCIQPSCLFFFFSFFLLQTFYIVWYFSYVSICKDLQKTIVLSSGPFLQVFTFTIQCICNLWWSENSPSEAIPQRPSHPIPKLLLCTIVEITLQHGCPCPL